MRLARPAALLLLILPALLFVARADAQPTPVGPSAGAPLPPKAAPGADLPALPILYSQLSDPDGASYTSQDFEPALDDADNQGAADFTVPPGEVWSIVRVFVPGEYFIGPGPTPAADVFLYRDDAGVPGSEIYSTRVAPPTVDAAGDLTLLLSPVPEVPHGTYWISVVAVMDFDPAGQWGWSGRLSTGGAPGMWRNPGDYFGSGCTDWSAVSGCIAGPADYLFQLEGEVHSGESCNSGVLGFEEPFPPEGWTVEQATAGPGAPWTYLAVCGEGNYTGGSGEAACASSDNWGEEAYDTRLISPSFGLVDVQSATATFLVNYQALSGDAFDVDVSADGGDSWTTLLHWTTDHGAFRSTPGVEASVGLKPFVGRTGLIARWRYYNLTAGAWDWYVVIDDIRLTCPLFADGFESANCDAWSAEVP